MPASADPTEIRAQAGATSIRKTPPPDADDFAGASAGEQRSFILTERFFIGA